MPCAFSAFFALMAVLNSLVPQTDGFTTVGGRNAPALARIPGKHVIKSETRVCADNVKCRQQAWRERPASACRMEMGFGSRCGRSRRTSLLMHAEGISSAGELAGDGGEGSPGEGAASFGGDVEESDDAPAMTKDFYSEIAARLNTTYEGAVQAEKEEQFDRSIYDELRKRRDFGLEQDLDLELEKRNITQEVEETRQGFESLEALPGVSGTTTVLPNVEHTPREVVIQVLEALKDNDTPYHNHGVEVFIRFLSPSAVMHGVEMDGVARYLAESRNRVLMHWDAIAYPRPLTLSGGKKNKAYQPLKLRDTMTGKWHAASVYLTLQEETKFWLMESIIVKGDI